MPKPQKKRPFLQVELKKIYMMVSFCQEARNMLVYLAKRISSFFISKGIVKEGGLYYI